MSIRNVLLNNLDDLRSTEPKSPFTFHIHLISLCYLTAVHNASPVTWTAENWELSSPWYHSMNSLHTKHKTLVSLVGRWYQGHPHSFVHIHSWLHFVWTLRCVHGLAYSLGNTIIYILWKSMPVCLLSISNPTLVCIPKAGQSVCDENSVNIIMPRPGRFMFLNSEWSERTHMRMVMCLPILELHSLTLLSIIALNFNGKIFFT